MQTSVEVAPAMASFSPAVAERRCFPRFAVSLAGICSVNLGPDVHCTSIDMSLGGIALRTGAKAKIGDAVIASFREFGMTRGRVCRLFEDGFAVASDKVDMHRSRLSQYLVWLLRGAEDDAERRGQERIVPLNRIMTLSRPDGRTNIGRVENVSRSGIAFTTTAAFDLGEAVRIGRYRATIARVFGDGAAARFDTELEAETFDVMISFAEP